MPLDAIKYVATNTTNNEPFRKQMIKSSTIPPHFRYWNQLANTRQLMVLVTSCDSQHEQQSGKEGERNRKRGKERKSKGACNEEGKHYNIFLHILSALLHAYHNKSTISIHTIIKFTHSIAFYRCLLYGIYDATVNATLVTNGT